MSEQEKVNILMVDDQPAKLLSYEVILKELDENLIKARSGREAGTPAQNRYRGRPHGREHAGTGRIRACRNDPSTP